MKYDLSNDKENQTAYIQFNHYLQNGRLIELKEIKKTRTNLQNAALHQFYVLISQELNNLGQEFTYIKPSIAFNKSKWNCRLFAEDDFYSTMYTTDIVKEHMWRPIQKTLFNIESTKELNTSQINDIADVLIKFFGEKGIYINFPNWQDKTRTEWNK